MGKKSQVGSSDDTIRLWDVDTGAHLRTLTGHEGYVYDVSFSPDGKTLASGSWSEIRLWDVATGELRYTLTGNGGYSVSFSPDGQMLASGGGYNETIRLWDVATGIPLAILTGHGDYVLSVSFSPDGQTFVSGSADGTVLLWDFTFFGNAIPNVIRDLPSNLDLSQHSPQWHLPEGATARLGKGPINELQYSPDSTRLAVASGIGIWIYDASSGQELALLTRHEGDVRSVSFSPDGKTIGKWRWRRNPSVGC